MLKVDGDPWAWSGLAADRRGEVPSLRADRPGRALSQTVAGTLLQGGHYGLGRAPVAGSRRQGSLRPQAPGIQKPGLLTCQRTRRQGEVLVCNLESLMTVTYEPSPVLPRPAVTQPRARPHAASGPPTWQCRVSVAARPVATLPRSWERPEAFLPPEQTFQGAACQEGPQGQPDEARPGCVLGAGPCPR